MGWTSIQLIQFTVEIGTDFKPRAAAGVILGVIH